MAVYFIDKPLKTHDIKLMDVYAELSAYDLVMFKKELEIKIDESTSYRVDAAAIIKVNDVYIPIVVEVDYTHFTNIKKIKSILFSYELDNKVKLSFIIIKLDQAAPEMVPIPNKNKYFVLPWNLEEYKKVLDLCLAPV